MDPLSSILSLLQPVTAGWNTIEAHNSWSIRFPGRRDAVVFWQLIEGNVVVDRDDGSHFEIAPGDFVLMALPPSWTMQAGSGGPVVHLKDLLVDGEQLHVAAPERITKVMAGYYLFASVGADILGRLMLPTVHVRAAEMMSGRLGLLLRILGEEALAERAGRAHILQHLLQLILVEALRQPGLGWQKASPGVLNGIADRHIGKALQLMHAEPPKSLTVAALASAAGLSRSAFAARFASIVGLPPIEYLSNWRMTLARKALEEGDRSMANVAELAGYYSVSAFSTAFRRVHGLAPTAFQRLLPADPEALY